MNVIQLPKKVRIVEVGPRDGLQNERAKIPTKIKTAFVNKLIEAGLTDIEVSSFVHPKAIPQLADATELFEALVQPGGVCFSALVPNERGLDRALAAGINRIAVFTAASDKFTQQNINMSIEESLATFSPLIAQAVDRGITVRAYLSTCFVCPFEGEIPTDRVACLTRKLLEMGADEVAISDTIGAASPKDILATVGEVLDHAPVEKIALHLHDTYGTALANVFAGMQLGIQTFDASAGGLGGCPFAPGAAGNLATEDLIYFLHRMGVSVDVDMDLVLDAADIIAKSLDRPPRSKQWLRQRGCIIHPMGASNHE